MAKSKRSVDVKSLYRAVSDGDVDRVKLLLSSKKYHVKYIGIALERALRNDLIDVSGVLVDDNHMMISEDIMNIAIKNRNVVKINFILKHNLYYDLSTPLKIASSNGYFDIVKLLVASNISDIRLLQAGLSAASKFGHVEIVKFILSHIPPLNEHIEPGRCLDDLLGEALYVAAENGHIEIADILLNHGVDIHYNGDSALIVAVADGQTCMVEFLLEKGADESVCYFKAVHFSHFKEIIRVNLLLDNCRAQINNLMMLSETNTEEYNKAMYKLKSENNI